MGSAPTELTGILVALVTPFTQDKKQIDFDALDQHVNSLIQAGVHGLVPGGSTGEFTVLSTEERKQLVEACIKSAAGRVPVVAGVGDLSTERTVELAVHAAKAGAASVMVVPPFYDALSMDQLKDFLGEIHQACNLPLCYYNIPSASGLTLTPEEIAGLSNVGVKYMKDTSGNAPDLTEFLFHRHNEITTFNGWDTLTFYGLAAGAKGSVWGATNIIPELSVELWNAVAVNSDIKKGRELWTKIWPICRLLEEGNYAGAVKTGMEIRGWSTGGLRKPFDLLKGEKRAKLAKLLKDAGVQTVE
ncbi:4-hydroxy-tetrahydrodipicolinate synthase [Pseudocercospora fuligena]|uniref:4-hydroxy-tetrahydrodipicolinate synthase n=1 Tax=Pseudocercospora fuligena TaxID=685502 RepID=A0A8H6RJ15_9PEZI|nr:4-hydroxy-tetrahydrodipicolinate synthase [Pseudocercospora fuligena]